MLQHFFFKSESLQVYQFYHQLLDTTHLSDCLSRFWLFVFTLTIHCLPISAVLFPAEGSRAAFGRVAVEEDTLNGAGSHVTAVSDTWSLASNGNGAEL